jgi:polysaccharide export outer membrane protein
MVCNRLLVLLLGAFVSLGSVVGLAQQPAAPTDYIIGPQDVLAITVWDQDDLSGKFAVQADGTFTFPLIGRVKVGGMTLREAESELKRLLKEGQIFKDPQVTLAVEQFRSQRVFIVGEVRSPGSYPMNGDMTLIEALAKAGSTLPSASDEVLLVRAKPGAKADGPTMPSGEGEGNDVTRVDLKDLQSGAAFSNNVQLQDGDTLFVARAESVYVFGFVKNPGAYAIKKDTTVLQALSLAGGVTDRGATGRIKVVRLVKGKKVELKAKLDFIVQPFDTIMVPERFW